MEVAHGTVNEPLCGAARCVGEGDRVLDLIRGGANGREDENADDLKSMFI